MTVAFSQQDITTLNKLKNGESVSDEEKNQLFSRQGGLLETANQQQLNSKLSTGRSLLDTDYTGNVDGSGGETGAGYEGGEFSKDKGTDTGYGNAVGVGTSVGNAVTGGFPGSGVLGNAVAGIASGKSNSDLAASLGTGFIQTGFSMMGLPGAVANAGFNAATSNNLGSAVGAAIGGLVGSTAGPLGAFGGSMVGSALGGAVGSSFSDGMLGDMTDTRSHEGYRDSLEEGMSYQQAASYAEQLDHYAALAQPTVQSTFAEDQAAAHPSNNASGFLGDPDIDSRDRTDATTPGGLMGPEGPGPGGAQGSGEGMGDSGGRSGGDPDGDAGSDPN